VNDRREHAIYSYIDKFKSTIVTPLIFSLSALNDLHLLVVFDGVDFSNSSHDLVLFLPFFPLRNTRQQCII